MRVKVLKSHECELLIKNIQANEYVPEPQSKTISAQVIEICQEASGKCEVCRIGKTCLKRPLKKEGGLQTWVDSLNKAAELTRRVNGD